MKNEECSLPTVDKLHPFLKYANSKGECLRRGSLNVLTATCCQESNRPTPFRWCKVRYLLQSVLSTMTHVGQEQHRLLYCYTRNTWQWIHFVGYSSYPNLLDWLRFTVRSLEMPLLHTVSTGDRDKKHLRLRNLLLYSHGTRNHRLSLAEWKRRWHNRCFYNI